MTTKEYLSSKASILGEYWNEFKIILYSIFAFLNINIDIVKTLLLLMAIDTFLGVIKSAYVKKVVFEFKKLLWGVISKLIILLIPMILALVALGLGYDFRVLVDAVLKILIISEAISAITNILSIRKKQDIQNTDFISNFLHIIREFLINKINKIIQITKIEK
jgi:hypothetical protein